MTIQVNLKTHTAQRIWDNYFRQVNRILRPVPAFQKDELLLELQGHVWESIETDSAESEADRVLNAIEKLGEPEEFLRPIVADKLLVDAASSLNPRQIVLALAFNLYSGIRRGIFSMFMGLGYFIFGIVFLFTFFKIIFPASFGFYIKSNGIPIIGMLKDMPVGVQDVLGYWAIPLGLLLSALIYFALTKMLKLLTKL